MLLQARLLSPLLLSLTAAASLFSPANAVTGFTGNFNSANWDYKINGNMATPGDCNDFSLFVNDCLEVNSPDAILALAYNGSAPAQLTWTWNNTYNTIYYVSFGWRVESDDVSTSFASYEIAGVPSGHLFLGATGNVTNARLGFNESISFKIDVVGSSSLPISFQVENYNAVVPGPLPAAGAASAFSFTRRLRRRCRGEGQATGRNRAPSPPSTYLTNQLNLPAASISSLPLSFSYGQPRPFAADAAAHHPSSEATST